VKGSGSEEKADFNHLHGEEWGQGRCFSKVFTLGIRNDGLVQVEVQKSLVSGSDAGFNVVSYVKMEESALESAYKLKSKRQVHRGQSESGETPS